MGCDYDASSMNIIATNGNRVTAYNYGSGYMRALLGNTNLTSPPSSETSGVVAPFIGVGSGDAVESANDYKLDNYINTLSYVSGVAGHNGDLTTKTTTFKNNTSSTIVVKELGLYYACETNMAPVLIARKVLDTPVSIEPGETKTFSVHIYINI